MSGYLILTDTDITYALYRRATNFPRVRPKKKDLIFLYINGCPVRQIARELGYTAVRIYQIMGSTKKLIKL